MEKLESRIKFKENWQKIKFRGQVFQKCPRKLFDARNTSPMQLR